MLHRFRRITSDTWFALGLEFFAILLGVLLALSVDEWREEREIQRNIDVAIERLNGEILENHEEIRQSLAIIEERFPKLAAVRTTGERPLSELTTEFGGFSFPDLKDSVWRRVSGDRLANRMPGDYIEAAFRLYNMNSLLDSQRLEIGDLSTHENFHDPARARIAHGIAMQILRQQIIWSREAMAVYDYFIQQHIDPDHDDDHDDGVTR